MLRYYFLAFLAFLNFAFVESVLAQSNCASFDPTPFQSGCGSITVPDTVHPGEAVTVIAEYHCSGASVSFSYGTSSVIVDGVPVTGTTGTGFIYDSTVSPSTSIQVPLTSQGTHTIIFTVSNSAPVACVQDKNGALVGPWAILSGSGWTSPRPFVITKYPVVTPGAKITDPPSVTVNGSSATVLMQKFSSAALKRNAKRLLFTPRKAAKKAKLTFAYQVTVKQTADQNGNPVKAPQRKRTSKLNSVTFANLPQGTYETSYKVQIMQKVNGQNTVVGNTKISPVAGFTIQ